MNVGTGIFKGKRTVVVIYADGTRKECPTWKKVMEEILKDYCKDRKKRKALYVETHYDADTLMRILTTRILDAVDYDYSGIQIAVQAE